MTTFNTNVFHPFDAICQFISSVRRKQRTPAAPTRVNLQRISLGYQKTHWIDAAASIEVICVAGCVWITADGELRDVVLAPGRVYTGTAGARLGIYALEAAEFIVQ